MTPECAKKRLSVAKERIYQLAEYIEWMASSPWYAVKQWLINRGYTINEINQAAQLYVVGK